MPRTFDEILREICDRYHRDSYNVLDHGAIGDGVTDDTAAFQKALDLAAAGGVAFDRLVAELRQAAIREAASKGGQSRTKAKRRASAANGKKGGRPRKPKEK